MGKTGPLWQFDAVGEIRVRQDAALDIGEAHPAKVVLHILKGNFFLFQRGI